ncbi:uncharacterized protein Dyak_GE27823 [Drosophila yakuba]|uniref:Uncharacterized protein n=1 Tax=Drosophila yakuba TaxID=7245 RepID=A0A0R1EBX0_DROYA|nr:uncharacterized protein Dyak_GE27823 [Drosophila yakuba]
MMHRSFPNHLCLPMTPMSILTTPGICARSVLHLQGHLLADILLSVIAHLLIDGCTFNRSYSRISCRLPGIALRSH